MLRTIAQLCPAISSQLRHVLTIRKKLVKQQYLLHMSSQHGELERLRSVGEFGAPQQISTGFASCLCFCNNVAHRRPTKLCTMFGCLVGWYTIYTFLGALGPSRNFARCKIHFATKSCVLLYWQRYCMALKQWVWAKLCGMVQGMELRNFYRLRHLYSAGRSSRFARPTF